MVWNRGVNHRVIEALISLIVNNLYIADISSHNHVSLTLSGPFFLSIDQLLQKANLIFAIGNISLTYLHIKGLKNGLV